MPWSICFVNWIIGTLALANLFPWVHANNHRSLEVRAGVGVAMGLIALGTRRQDAHCRLEEPCGEGRETSVEPFPSK